jgi:EAL domain-containing protein (putative c-di-GMP-specific phosphodiesterase class I)
MEPSQFFDAAERSYLITTLDRIVLKRALERLSDTDPRLLLATNVSAQSLADPGYFEFVMAELDRTGIEPDRLNLEVTETSLVDVSDAVKRGMESLSSIGATWWVDDFGTGYSSISHLRDLPVGGLKLDRSFTVGVASGDYRSIRVAQGLAGLARGLSLKMIVEGVQGERDAAVLLGQGWAMAQGWYFGRPTAEMAWQPEAHHLV